ncbi:MULTISPECIES: MBL fold metallo-hydrolase [unclassified Arsukibacterium]|uniref:MBL fold metallo-hydrolase n=1 Tax=unclassified Arsukibacterium TaxID=2635278 RepID=UPI000C509553|nr:MULTISPECIES: MBL fold metallo-hydrolase [unclassified Arsukibacterium]MAA96121.1 sulfurtransferase [Rheinheimera sp.]MBM35469.1 sulfurtransferase [Rheinheimera sp.]HAW93615.1 sulfurtransferase [Candidatus Azambacteria bacterium]|tara:strand:- start:31988 stop:33352 length:1365 start_codon:yes stop_codon:yes gene_type:complete
MELRRIETPGIAHYAWLLADGEQAMLVDPSRHVQKYLDTARDIATRITHIVETHRQEDFVMGAAWLARRTGARIYNGNHDTFGHGDCRLEDGDTFYVGKLLVRAFHTPGHTPESMCYAVYKDDNAESAWAIFTGDTLFFGDTGRSDLPDEDKSVENAGRIYDAVHNKLAGLGDTALILPAHGPGSVCGSGMAKRSWSTLGDEKTYNDVFTLSRQEFAEKKGGERLPRPPYFRHMEKVNLEGGLPPTLRQGDVGLLNTDSFADKSQNNYIYDTRLPEAFAGGHIPDSHSIWLGGLPVFGGWVGNADSAIYLVTDRNDNVDHAVRHLSNIGLDNVQGALAGGFESWRDAGRDVEHSGAITPAVLHNMDNAPQVLDVREIDEFDSGHIPGALHCYVGYLADKLNELPLDKTRPVVVTCGVGHRAGLGVSILLKAGFQDVSNLLGGMKAWSALGLPVE